MWIWELIRDNYFLGSVMVVCGIAAIWSIFKNKNWMVAVVVLIMSLVQWKTTTVRSLTDLTNDQQRVVELRKSAYPPITWAPIAYWLEEKPITIAVNRWAESLFENLDPNQYFFAFHPRERVGHKEIEKLPYVLLPLALLGLWRLAKEKIGKWAIGITILCLMLLAIVGNQSTYGGLATWPLWIMALTRSIWPRK